MNPEQHPILLELMGARESEPPEPQEEGEPTPLGTEEVQRELAELYSQTEALFRLLKEAQNVMTGGGEENAEVGDGMEMVTYEEPLGVDIEIEGEYSGVFLTMVRTSWSYIPRLHKKGEPPTARSTSKSYVEYVLEMGYSEGDREPVTLSAVKKTTGWDGTESIRAEGSLWAGIFSDDSESGLQAAPDNALFTRAKDKYTQILAAMQGDFES